MIKSEKLENAMSDVEWASAIEELKRRIESLDPLEVKGVTLLIATGDDEDQQIDVTLLSSPFYTVLMAEAFAETLV